ncbi:tyrosine-protein kinase family protein [Sorangium sp. So ce1097]|uniref:tyrosine-protein kinase family protein n=1 Tax=Sorangium sp. So ce1097 TaxID=3133330 RepID=UPI003F642B20
MIAFYAYKGGTGRTTTLLHTAWALAREGRRVAMLDLDLSAPSLSQLVFPKDEPAEGFVEYMTMATKSPSVNAIAFLQDVRLDDDAKGELRLLGAGRMDAGYLRELATLDWQRLLTPGLSLDKNGQVTFGARSLFDRLCDSLAPVADVVLIDAPTGLNDTANVCLRRLADVVVVLFAPSRVQMDGVGRVVSLLAEEQALRGRPNVLCVASTIHAHRLTFDHMKRIERAFQYLEKVRYDALGHPPLDDPEKLDAIEQPRVHVPYEAALADTDDICLQHAPNKDDFRLYEDLIRLLDEEIPRPSPVTSPGVPALQGAIKNEVVEDLLLQFPQPIAEQETDSDAFLRTEHVRAVRDPTTVLILGGKGSGKTALFQYCQKNLFSKTSRHIAVHGPGVEQLGMDVLSDMVEAKLELDVVWRVYALSRLDSLPADVPQRARDAASEIGRIARRDTAFDPASSLLREAGLGREVDTAWQAVENELNARGEQVLLFLDGLDTPFKGSLERRRAGLSQLFIAWRATFERLRHVQLKVFLRTDLWHELSFPEKSHVNARSVELKWEPRLLWQMLLKRALRSSRFARSCEERGILPALTWQEVEKASEPELLPYLDALFEQRIWTKKTALSRNWITRRLKDARDILYPRDALWLMRSALEGEMERLSNGRRTSTDSAISRESLAAALVPTSEQRVQAVREESPELVDVLEWLNGVSAKGQLDDLRQYLMNRPGSNPAEDLERLQRTGVLRVTEGEYSVPDLYVPGLKMKRPGPK